MRIKNQVTDKIHGNTVILNTFRSYEEAENWVGVYYLLNS